MIRNIKIYILLHFLITLDFSLCAQEENTRIDSLLKIIEINGGLKDTTQVNLLVKLCSEYTNIGDSENAMKYGLNALSMAKQINYKKGEAAANNGIGVVYEIKSEFEEANQLYQRALVVYSEINDKLGLANTHVNIGNVYNNLGDYDKAFKSYLSTLKISEEINYARGMANAYNNIGNVYYYLKQYDKVLENYKKAIPIFEKLDDKEGLSLALSNIGAIYTIVKDYDRALDMEFRALKVCEERGCKAGMASAYSNIASVYEAKKNYTKALETHKKSMSLNEELGDNIGLMIDYINIGNALMYVNKNSEAKIYLNKALEIAKESGAKDNIKDVYGVFCKMYEQEKNFLKAYEYHKLYSDLKDSLLNEASTKQITEMNTKYESEKKEKEIELLTKDKELQGAEIGKQKLIRNGVIGGLFVALLFAFVLFNRFRVTSKQKKIIEHQNSQIVESINYSKKIQDALLPSVSLMQQSLPGLFVFYEPKDIVSGDFYYFKEYEKYVLLACVDCTGHGVPGGFMSTLGSLLLDKITDNSILSPSEILSKLSDEIVRVLHQQSGGEIQDGMDLSVCMIDKKNRTVDFSGARNGIIVVSNNEARRYKANPLPVGGNYMKKGQAIQRNFQTEKIQLQANDWVYMYTDGFMEQSGGESGVPMTSSEFENKLIALSQQPTENKQHYAQTELDKWRGVNERADDVLIVGFQL